MNYQELIINLAVGVVLSLIKKPADKAKFRSALLKIFRAIKAGFPGDVDFS